MAETPPKSNEPLLEIMREWLAADDSKIDYAIVGEFLTCFAAAESTILQAVRAVSGLGEDRARIILNGMRTSDLIPRLRALLKLDGDPRLRDAEECFTQLAAIGVERDKFAHSETTFAGNLSVITSNIHHAKDASQIKVDRISTIRLIMMITDLRVMQLRFLMFVMPSLKERHPTLHAPYSWQYRPHVQPKPSPESRKRRTGRARRPPPQSSEA